MAMARFLFRHLKGYRLLIVIAHRCTGGGPWLGQGRGAGSDRGAGCYLPAWPWNQMTWSAVVRPAVHTEA
jgi:hypothetical protein